MSYDAICDGHECVLLAALMNGTDDLPITADDFSSPPNRVIFERINSLTNRCLLAVTDALTRNDELERVGGAGRITEIAMMTHDKEVLQYSLGEVLEHSRARKAAKIGRQMYSGGITPEQAREQLDQIMSLQRNGDISDLRVKSELTTGLKSLLSHKSQPCDDYPAPLSSAAYHGLAGAFVQRVLPETEADPAALLSKFLAEVGNVIGRRPHAIADGARHAVNLYVATVGPTAKSRKGTSACHVQRVIKHADADWTRDNVTGGLSSGEGLIWRVRDPIIKTVNGEVQVVDQGVIDKRCFVFQGEFSGILKVMGREGNTLSSVLRDAWDGVKLTTLTKNSPAVATDTHISVVAHITREELRKQLTETESANGFGNGFLWLLVNRSKILPEGGQTPAMADIVERLKEALQFARATDQIKRTEAARELWAEIYPALSEGKPGLVGALTARSEAQVLRLSCLYALLDCSPLVDVAHLKAALEIWRYCEDSARLIFESGTGNKDADRVLQALKVAGESGLSRTELVHDVFGRHATRFEIDEALRLLHGLDLAHCTQEKTAGQPLERWFAAKP